MPPLSAYTPFESLLFFQSLAAFSARPASFSDISNTLRTNPFVCQDVDFDTDRLSPEALEDLYVTLLQEWLEQRHISLVSSSNQNGHHPDSPGTNPKKRKISTPAADAVANEKSHQMIVPSLISHLYTRYRDGVTREIRNEEKRYREIHDEIEQLQKEVQTDAQLSSASEAPCIMPRDREELARVRPALSAPSNIEPGAEGTGEQSALLDAGQLSEMSVVGQGGKGSVPQLSGSMVRPLQAKQPLYFHFSEVARTPQAYLGSPPLHPPQGYRTTTRRRSSSLINRNAPVWVAQHPSQQPSSPSKTLTIAPEVPQLKQKPQPLRAVGFNRSNQPNAPPGTGAISPVQQGPAPSFILPRSPTVGEASGRSGPGIVSATMGSQFATVEPQFQQRPPQQVSPKPYPSYTNQLKLDRQVPSSDVPAVLQPDGRTHQGPYSPNGPTVANPITAATQSSHQNARSQMTTSLDRQTPSFIALARKRPPFPSVETSRRSLTPWKRSPRLSLNIPKSPGPSVRPRPEDVSPISERAISPVEALESLPQRSDSLKEIPDIKSPKLRQERQRGIPLENVQLTTREENHIPFSMVKHAEGNIPARGRGHSVTSRSDDSHFDSSTAHHKLIPEMLSVSGETSEDMERISDSKKAVSVTGYVEGLAKGRLKRKRTASDSLDIGATQSFLSRHQPTQYILCARNFPRTGAPLMNDVAAHKHASIFAKPLRDVPGYRGLIYRPQDLKSIKSAIHQGSKAVVAATEAANTPAADGESPAPSGTPSKNTLLMLQKAVDLVPPKGIVNSSQLEKELIRMFANAVMFNPAPDHERGFGPAFLMTKDGEPGDSAPSREPDEGGIIHDTREMCEDVERAVTRWRAAERTVDELINSRSILSLRRGSASDVNIGSPDEVRG